MTMTERVRSEFPESSDIFCASYGITIRNQMLMTSDWTQLPDAPCDRQAWADYRQALRDMPANPNWPNVKLPDSPQ